MQSEAKAGTRPGEAVRPAWHGCARWVTAIGGHGGGPDLGARFGPPPEKFPMDAEKRPRTVHQQKKKEKIFGQTIDFLYIRVYICIYNDFRQCRRDKKRLVKYDFVLNG